MRSFRLGAFLVLTILVGVVAVAAYDLGLSAGTADAAVAAGASVVYATSTISPLGLIIGGFLLLLLIGFLARIIVGPRRGYRGRGPSYDRHWDGENVPEPFRPMLERWHAQAHGAGTTPVSGGPGMGSPIPPPAWRPPSDQNPPPNQPPTGA